MHVATHLQGRQQVQGWSCASCRLGPPSSPSKGCLRPHHMSWVRLWGPLAPACQRPAHRFPLKSGAGSPAVSCWKGSSVEAEGWFGGSQGVACHPPPTPGSSPADPCCFSTQAWSLRLPLGSQFPAGVRCGREGRRGRTGLSAGRIQGGTWPPSSTRPPSWSRRVTWIQAGEVWTLPWQTVSVRPGSVWAAQMGWPGPGASGRPAPCPGHA